MTAFCLWAAVQGIDDFGQVRDSFAEANYATLPVLLILLIIFYWIKAIRWKLLLSPLKQFRTAEIVPPMMIGFMGNNVLPFHLGELIRVYVLSRDQQLSKTAVLSSVVLERIFDIVAILVFFGSGLLFVKGLPESYRTRSLYIAGGTIVLVLFLLLYVFWTHRFVKVAERILAGLRFLPVRLRERLVEMLESGATGLGSMKSGRLTFWIVVTSAAQWAVNGLMIYIALWSFGITLSPLASFVVMGVTAFGVTLPSSPGFFGVIQLCFWISLKPFGEDQATVFAASVYYHLSQYIPVTLTGLYFWNRTGLRLTAIKQDAVAEGDPLVSEGSVADG